MIIKNLIIYIVLLFSFVIHEYSHAFIASKLGDDSESLKKRLTLNPIPHIDIIGSVFLPLILLFSNSVFFIGWAKPVKIDIQKFSKPDRDFMLSSIAGPLSNLSIAVLCVVVAKILFSIIAINELIYQIFFIIIFINIILFLFNMFPIPPLDGSRFVLYILSDKYKNIYIKSAPILMLVLFILMFSGIFYPIISFISEIINGVMF